MVLKIYCCNEDNLMYRISHHCAVEDLNLLKTLQVVPRGNTSRFSSNSEANASELLENQEECFLATADSKWGS